MDERDLFLGHCPGPDAITLLLIHVNRRLSLSLHCSTPPNPVLLMSFCFVGFFVFKTGSVTLAGLELTELQLPLLGLMCDTTQALFSFLYLTSLSFLFLSFPSPSFLWLSPGLIVQQYRDYRCRPPCLASSFRIYSMGISVSISCSSARLLDHSTLYLQMCFVNFRAQDKCSVV